MDFQYSEILDRDGYVCYNCGDDVTNKKYHIDHLVPIFLGGAHAPYNVAVSCETCNVRKGHRMTDAAVRKRGLNMMHALSVSLSGLE